MKILDGGVYPPTYTSRKNPVGVIWTPGNKMGKIGVKIFSRRKKQYAKLMLYLSEISRKLVIYLNK